MLSEVGRVKVHFLFDAFFDAVEAFFEIADLIGELPVGVVDDTAGLFNNGENSILRFRIETGLQFPANSSFVLVFVDHSRLCDGVMGLVGPVGSYHGPVGLTSRCDRELLVD